MKHSLPALTLMDVLSKKADKSPNAPVVCIELHKKMKGALEGGNKFLATKHQSIWPIFSIIQKRADNIQHKKQKSAKSIQTLSNLLG